MKLTRRITLHSVIYADSGFVCVYPTSLAHKSINPQANTYFTSSFQSHVQKQSTGQQFEISKHSSSIKEFLFFFQKAGKRYVAPREGFSWVTSNSHLRNITSKHFQKHINNFAISSSNGTSPSHTFVSVRPDDEQKSDLEALSLTSNISAGGIPALWAAYIQSVLYAEKAFPVSLLPPVYIMSPNIRSSAAFGSSTQFHVSHASPMYTDKEFSTLNILKATLLRNTFPQLDSPERDNYMIAEIYPSAFFNPTVLSVGAGYLYYEWQYKVQSAFGLKTVLNETIPLAIKSGKVMDSAATLLAKPILLRKDTVRVAYNAAETKEMEELQESLKEYDIECMRISKEEALDRTGTAPHTGEGGSIWAVRGDGNVIPDVVDTLIEGIRKNGGRVIEGNVSSILYSNEDERLSGVIVSGQENGHETRTLIRTNHLFTSFGARSRYVKQGPISSFSPVEPIISGTGYSAFLLVEGEITTPIDSNNSHFTPLETAILEDGKKITLVKSTCGGTIGADSFCLDHAVNSLYYAINIIFPGRKVEIFAAKSCSRPLNRQNSGKLQEVIPGFWAGTGYGGKGITDAAGLAATKVLERITDGVVSDEQRVSFQGKLLHEYVSSRDIQKT